MKSPQDADYYAGMIGTRKSKKETVQVEDALFWEKRTGIKSVREVEEFIVHPNQIKELAQGEVFAVSRTVDPKWGLVRVEPAPNFSEVDVSPEELKRALLEIRNAYLRSGKERYMDLGKLAARPGLKTIPSNPVTEKADAPTLWS